MNETNTPSWLVPPAAVPPVADLSEAARLLSKGFHLVPLVPFTKQPAGERWNAPENRVTSIDPAATGYGLPLASNGLASIDLDNVAHAATGFAAWGFDLEAIMQAGVRTRSTRPGSGGRSTFKVAAGVSLAWVKIASRTPGFGTILELRATSPNLQDAIPGVMYRDKAGNLCTQQYANEHRLDDAPELPPELLAFWQRLSTDLAFYREQQAKFCAAIGAVPNLAISGTDSSGKITLAHRSPKHAQAFNAAHSVPDILSRHGYTQHRNGRWAHPEATGQPGVHEIPGKDGLWYSPHGGDPLTGTFDAWIAHVELNFGGDLAAAQAAADREQAEVTAGMFGPVADATAGAGQSKKFSVELLDDLSVTAAIPDELVQGLILSESVVMLDGASNAGKTFLTVALAAAVQQGTPFMGRQVQQGQVVYVGAESPGSIRTRALAHQMYYGKSAGFALIPATPDMFADDSDLNGLIEAVRSVEQERGKVRLIVLDTLAAISGAANENTSEMAAVMRRIERLKAELQTCVLPVHHTGKNAAAGARGWSGIRASVDTEIEVVSDDITRSITFTKQRDLGSKGLTLNFALKVVTLGLTNFGEVATSCVAVAAGASVTTPAVMGSTEDARLVEFIRHQSAAGIFLTANQLRDEQIEGVRSVRRVTSRMIRDGLLVTMNVPRLLNGGRSKKAVFLVGEGHRAMLNAALELAKSPAAVDAGEGLIELVERLREEVKGNPPPLSCVFDGTEPLAVGKVGKVG